MIVNGLCMDNLPIASDSMVHAYVSLRVIAMATTQKLQNLAHAHTNEIL